ncbi:MAG: OsmC family protein [Flavicella sp.]
MPTSSITLSTDNYRAEAKSREHKYFVDTPVAKGGKDQGPTPVEYFLTAIGTCVAITLRVFAEKKEWNLGEINVTVTEKTRFTATGIEKIIHEEISVEKEISEIQMQALYEQAKACPVAQMVATETKIESKVVAVKTTVEV